MGLIIVAQNGETRSGKRTCSSARMADKLCRKDWTEVLLLFANRSKL